MAVVLYHGSPKKLLGKKLRPSWGNDSNERPDNQIWGVYASDLKKFAITIALLNSRGVLGGSIDQFKKPFGTIYGKILPKQRFIYLHSVSQKTFKKSPKVKHQYVSKKAVAPLSTERLLVADYLDLIRVASTKETKKWLAKYSKT